MARAARSAPGGAVIGSYDDLAAWLAGRERAELDEPFTYTLGADGVLRLAPRRSEHVACAGGEPVCAAGELGFARGRGEGRWLVAEASNLSTGYCPDVTCWPALAAALDHLGVGRPDAWTYPITFRRCAACGERNIVRDHDFTCALCAAELPRDWNFA
ncbi:MAG: hypothetical protein HOV68_13145 [Streptomycetaceae bacterium]|nr:hypothetical protein [Streptomycetaceae bacterium]